MVALAGEAKNYRVITPSALCFALVLCAPQLRSAQEREHRASHQRLIVAPNSELRRFIYISYDANLIVCD